MFFDLVSRNSKRSRKENGLFFASLLAAIVAFYIILSLSHQDVMLFLNEMESDAVNRLMTMIPLFYAMTLFLLFFLVYFACKFQLQRRSHEFGVYLMMGMRRSKLFLLLLAEDLKSNVIALLIGLPVAIFLSEIISLVTARLVGVGIIGHRISVSWHAILLTVIGFLAIKLAAFLILSGKIVRQEIGSLLIPAPEGTKKQLPSAIYTLSVLVGIAFLAIAYAMAIKGLSWQDVSNMALTFLLGFSGTLLLFFGLRSAMSIFAGRAGKKQRLHTFTFRQLQEYVIHRSNALAISSLLILAALCCFGCGVAIAKFYGASEPHAIDYTFSEWEDPKEVQAKLETGKLSSLFSNIFEMKVGYIRRSEDYDSAYSMDRVMSALEHLPDSEDKTVLLDNLGYTDYPYLISLSGYNQLLSIADLPQIVLSDDEAAVYMDTDFTTPSRISILNQILATRPEVTIAGEPHDLTGTVQTTNLVVDRSITLSFALIVPDEVFDSLTTGDYSTYLNAVFAPEETSHKSLLTCFLDTNEKLDALGLSYESYLQNMGRQLFYVVAASYITIYLAIIFLIIANTIIGVQFLTQQQKTARRYQTLIRLGASYESLCCSANQQISWYFGIPTIIAALSSIFGTRALFTGLLSSRTQVDIPSMMVISAAMILLLCVVEWIYMTAVKRSSSHFLLSLMAPKREE